MDLCLQLWCLLLHNVSPLLEQLEESRPLAFDLVNVEPVLRPAISLLLQKLLTGLAFLELGFPLVYYSIHFLDFGDNHCDVF